MAFCKNCGKELNEGATFCSNCGAAVNTAPVEAAPVYAGNVNEQTGTGKINVGMLVFSIISTICCCLPTGIIALIFTILAKDEPTAEGQAKKNKVALILNIVGVVLGLISLIISLVSFISGVGIIAELVSSIVEEGGFVSSMVW